MTSDDRTFIDRGLSGATFRGVDLSETAMRGVVLRDDEIDGEGNRGRRVS